MPSGVILAVASLWWEMLQIRIGWMKPNGGISVLRTMTRWHYQRWHSRLINVFTPWARIFLYKILFAKSTNFLIWILSSSGILGRVACFRTKVSGLHIGSIFKVASCLAFTNLRCIIAQKTDEFSWTEAKAYNLATPLCVEPENWFLRVEQNTTGFSLETPWARSHPSVVLRSVCYPICIMFAQLVT